MLTKDALKLFTDKQFDDSGSVFADACSNLSNITAKQNSNKQDVNNFQALVMASLASDHLWQIRP